MVFGAVLLGAAGLRLAQLENRPMHCDEAVHAVKFGLLLEKGQYRYDPHEFHGPTLNYATLPIAWLCGARSLPDITERHLRTVAALFGLLLVVMPLGLRRELGATACLSAMLLTAISPAMVFYSRYYIQEMLLVAFSFAAIIALWRLRAAWQFRPDGSAVWLSAVPASIERPHFSPVSRKAILWLVVLALCLGLMHATKETCVIALLAMVVAAVVALPEVRRLGLRRLTAAAVVVLFVAAGVSALLMSGFGQHPQGVLDSYATYLTYFRRAGGAGSEGPHVYPPWQYLRWLLAWRGPGGAVCSEALIALLAAVGIGAALGRFGVNHIQLAAARFFAVYTMLMTAAYAAIPYKTPWCAIGFLHGLIMLAALGAAALLGVLRHATGKIALAVALLAAAGQLTWQAYRASFVWPADPDNPYVYAHTSPQLLELVAEVQRIAERSGLSTELYVQVICPEDDYWPLPWYLREYRRIGWYGQPPDAPPAPLIITQPEMEEAVVEYVYTWPKPGERFQYVRAGPAAEQPLGWELRPNVFLAMYLRRELWELTFGDSRP